MLILTTLQSDIFFQYNLGNYSKLIVNVKSRESHVL